MTDIGSKAFIPNPALAPLAFLIGEWRTTGTHPMLPGVELLGMTSFAWADGGAFLVMRSQVDADGFPDGIAYIGSDDLAGAFQMIYLDEREVSRLYTVEVGDRTVTWSRDDDHLAQSMTVMARSDGTLVSEGRMSQDRGPWGADLSQVFTTLA